MAPFRAKINPDHFGADINILFIITYLSYYFRGGAKKQPVPWPGGPGYNGAYVYDCNSLKSYFLQAMNVQAGWATRLSRLLPGIFRHAYDVDR